MAESRPELRLLQLVPEPLPTHRPDVRVLFGDILPQHGILCDLIGRPGDTPEGGRLRREFSFFMLCLRQLLAANRRQYFAVQVRDMALLGVVARIICAFKGMPLFYWMSFLFAESRIVRAASADEPLGRLRRIALAVYGRLEHFALYRLVLPACRHVFVQSSAMARHVAVHGVPEDKMTAVPMGVDLDRILDPAIVAQRLPQWPDQPVIAYLGSLDTLRRLDALIDMLKILHQRGRENVRLLLIGDGSCAADTDFLREHARQSELEQAMHITGWLPGAQAWALLKGADIAISPIPRGPLLDVSSPTKLLEYLALGMPCIGNDSPDQAEVLKASGAGLLCRLTPTELAERAIELLDNLPAARIRAASGLDYIRQQRSYSVLGARLAAVYRRLAGESA
mgnify:FL=1